MSYRVAVAGCTGYVGGELLRLLVDHPYTSVGAVTAHSNAGARLGDLQPHLVSMADVLVEETSAEILEEHDVIFLALPHGASAELVEQLNPDVLVIDCGADFRLSSANDWEEFYGSSHAGTWPYGLPELPNQRKLLTETRRITVPGCYPTATTLALAPAVVSNLVDTSDTVIVAASGTSGAGKALKTNLLGSEIMGSASAYSVGGVHRHIPEILQNLRSLGAGNPRLSFTPVLVPMSRGILATCTAPVQRGVTKAEVRTAYVEYYENEPFVTVLPEGMWPTTGAVLGSNVVQLQVGVDEASGRLVAIAAIDNLTKGTAGGAIQCMNIILDFPETAGLPMNGVAP